MISYSERHGKRFPRMWWKVGLLCEAKAYELVEKGAYPDQALAFARAAEACFWQATGEGDAKSISNIVDGSDE